MSVTPSRTRWMLMIVVTVAPCAGGCVGATLSPELPVTADHAAHRAAPPAATPGQVDQATRFAPLRYGNGATPPGPGVALLIERSATAKREYSMIVVSPSSGQSLIPFVDGVELSYGGKVVYRGRLTDHVGPYMANLVTVRFTEDVASGPLEFGRSPRGWEPPVITGFDAIVK
jgi:hypothetical protein